MINCRLFTDYLFHTLTSKTRHGVHSPFVYRLVDEVIYDYSSKAYEIEIESLQSSMNKHRRIMKVTDLDTSSVQNNDIGKKAGKLASHALKPARVSKLIARLADFSKPSTIVELSPGYGVTAAFLAKSLPSSDVIAIERSFELASIAKENFTAFDLTNIDLRIGHIDPLFVQVLAKLERLDFLLINNSQTKQATWSCFNACLPKVHEGTVLIFDGIYQSHEMKELWTDIKKHPKVTVTIDLFHIGLVFFKKDQAKEDFKIRFF